MRQSVGLPSGAGIKRPVGQAGGHRAQGQGQTASRGKELHCGHGRVRFPCEHWCDEIGRRPKSDVRTALIDSPRYASALVNKVERLWKMENPAVARVSNTSPLALAAALTFVLTPMDIEDRIYPLLEHCIRAPQGVKNLMRAAHSLAPNSWHYGSRHAQCKHEIERSDDLEWARARSAGQRQPPAAAAHARVHRGRAQVQAGLHPCLPDGHRTPGHVEREREPRAARLSGGRPHGRAAAGVSGLQAPPARLDDQHVRAAFRGACDGRSHSVRAARARPGRAESAVQRRPLGRNQGPC